jgi:hypothetical protein
MTRKQGTPTPYVAPEILAGRLVRRCPECREEIVEVTDHKGIVSDNFAAHWEEEHREQPPERTRCYLLGLTPRSDGAPGPGPEALRNVSRQILSWVRNQMPDLDWELVERFEDLPEDAAALLASDVLRGSWGMEGDDPQVSKVRCYRRKGDSLAFAPTRAQWDEWDAARERAKDVRAALIERHRDELPKFTGKSVEDWERYYARLTRREDRIAKAFDSERDAALHQFLCGDYRWQATLESAIADLAIPDEEVDELRAQTRASIEEAEAKLRAT